MIGFGTGGWRAVIGEEFTKANVQLLTAALARKMKDEGTQGNGFVIGYDRRFLSGEAAKWAAEGMAGLYSATGQWPTMTYLSKERPWPRKSSFFMQPHRSS